MKPTLYWEILTILTAVFLICSCEKSEDLAGAEDNKTVQKETESLSLSVDEVDGQVKDEGTGEEESSIVLNDTSSEAKPEPPEIVSDSSVLDMDVGFSRPELGDKIYTWKNLPEDACGTYWIKDSRGKISKIAVCRDHHE